MNDEVDYRRRQMNYEVDFPYLCYIALPMLLYYAPTK